MQFDFAGGRVALLALRIEGAKVNPTICAVCTSTVGPFELRPLGRDEALVNVCARCDDEHPRAGRYGFSGGVSARGPASVTVATGGRRSGAS